MEAVCVVYKIWFTSYIYPCLHLTHGGEEQVDGHQKIVLVVMLCS